MKPSKDGGPFGARDDLLEVGRVLRPHGLRGELRVRLHWSDSTTLFEVDRVNVRFKSGEERELPLKSARSGGRGVLIWLDGVDDIDAADAFREGIISVYRSDLPPLDPGEYYLSDLVGAEVVAPDGLIGKVVELGLHPTMDTLVIETEAGQRLEQPLMPAWISRIDAAAGRIELYSRDGLIS